MNKPVIMTPQLYSRFGAQYKRLRSMKQGQFVQWACTFWQNASVYDADTLYSDLLTIRGIGPKRARDIINKITEGSA